MRVHISSIPTTMVMIMGNIAISSAALTPTVVGGSIYDPQCAPCASMPTCPGLEGAILPAVTCAIVGSTYDAVKAQMLKGSGCPWDEVASPLVCSSLVLEGAKLCGSDAVAAIEPKLTTITQQSCFKIALECTEKVSPISEIMAMCTNYPVEEDPCEPCTIDACPGSFAGAVLPKSKCTHAASQVAFLSNILSSSPTTPESCDFDAAMAEICGAVLSTAGPQTCGSSLPYKPSFNGCMDVAKCRADFVQSRAEVTCAATTGAEPTRESDGDASNDPAENDRDPAENDRDPAENDRDPAENDRDPAENDRDAVDEDRAEIKDAGAAAQASAAGGNGDSDAAGEDATSSRRIIVIAGSAAAAAAVVAAAVAAVVVKRGRNNGSRGNTASPTSGVVILDPEAAAHTPSAL